MSCFPCLTPHQCGASSPIPAPLVPAPLALPDSSRVDSILSTLEIEYEKLIVIGKEKDFLVFLDEIVELLIFTAQRIDEIIRQ